MEILRQIILVCLCVSCCYTYAITPNSSEKCIFAVQEKTKFMGLFIYFWKLVVLLGAKFAKMTNFSSHGLDLE